MALDGFFIHAHVHALNQTLEGLKIDKIYQINATDLLLNLRGRGSVKLFISAHASHPRIILIDSKPETPQEPPMFCMLMRKHISGGIIQSVEQDGLERIVTINISARNELGDIVIKHLKIEIMGKHSNIMLLDENQTVVDSIKRIRLSMSTRPMGPGVRYTLPPSTKAPTFKTDRESFSNQLTDVKLPVFKWLYLTFEGISPSLANSITHQAGIDSKTDTASLEKEDIDSLYASFIDHIEQVKRSNGVYMYFVAGTYKEFSSIPLTHYRSLGYEERFTTDFDEALNTYYHTKKDTNRVSQKSNHLIKLVDLHLDKLNKKVENLEGDLIEAGKLEALRLRGELLTANLHAIKKGMKSITVFNYYTNEDFEIELDVTRGPNENAQRYYKRYNKAKTTLEEAQKFIEIADEEIRYLDHVRLLLDQAESPDDIEEIKEELMETGFVKKIYSKKQKRAKKLPPHRYESSEGVTILVGRNNFQNDELTLKKSFREHIWLHTKDTPGSHVIIQAEFEDIDDQTIIEAAEIAAYHSKARYSSQVPVDFTEVKFVKKPSGAKPGMVIYEDYKTIYVTPDEDKILNMKKVD